MERLLLWALIFLLILNAIFTNYQNYKKGEICTFNVRELAKVLMEQNLSEEEIDEKIKRAKRYVYFLIESGKCEIVFTKDAIVASNKVIDVTQEVLSRVR